MKRRFRIRTRVWCVGVYALWGVVARAGEPVPNIILFIGDGMGPAQVQAGRIFAGAPLSFETFPYTGVVSTAAANAAITDSAAAGTALATGNKANNGVISMALPGDGAELPTVLEYLQQVAGRRTGLVTTSYMTDATPAVFAAHEPTRANTAQIADDYLQRGRPALLLGGGGNGLSPAAAQAAGYLVVTNAAGLQAAATSGATRVSGQFGSSGPLPYEYDGYGGLPRLDEMTAFALGQLATATNGFFLMVEGGRIDHACHANDIARAIPEVLGLSRAVAVATNWAAGSSNTLIVVTADHETGGLQIVQALGAGTNPVVAWATTGHTATPVPVFGWGAQAGRVTTISDNTGVFDMLMGAALGRPVCVNVVADSNSVALRWAGVSRHDCRLERTADLGGGAWTNVQTRAVTNGPAVLADTNAPAAGPAFYRLTGAPR